LSVVECGVPAAVAGSRAAFSIACLLRVSANH
jgi:hypothetical protein